MRRAVIGILGNTYMTVPGKFTSMEREYVNSTYIQAILNNGGMPLVIPAVSLRTSAEEALSMCDGILVPGGEDVHPWHYGEEPTPLMGAVRPEIDEAWLAAGRWAKENKIPMLGICKGIQLINVLYGGSLYQDLSMRGEGVLQHMQQYDRIYLTHHVEVAEGSRLAEVLGAGRHATNSMHHQAIKELGEGLKASAYADDGVIEAVEDEEGLVLAVQWHPEGLTESAPEMNKLFADLVHRAEARHKA